MKKICIACEEMKSAFYKHPQMTDGYLNVCVDCVKDRSRKRRNEKKNDGEWLEAERKRCRERNKRLDYKNKYKPKKEDKKRWTDTYYEKYPERKSAQHVISNLRTPSGFNWHHWSYNDEHLKDVILILRERHYDIHRFLDYDRVAKIFRTKDGGLLDSRDKHEKYLESILL